MTSSWPSRNPLHHPELAVSRERYWDTAAPLDHDLMDFEQIGLKSYKRHGAAEFALAALS